MKILMTLMGLEIGGAETHVVELSKSLAARGYDISVASRGGVYVSELERAGIRHYNLPLHTKNPAALIKSYFGLKRIIKRERFDTVHAHARIPAFVCGLLAKSMDFRFITSTHGVYKVDPLLLRISDWGEHAVAVSCDVKQYLIDNYNIPSDNISLTINGIDTERFSLANTDGGRVRRELGIAESAFTVVYVSRIDVEAALPGFLLCEAVERLISEIPELRILIVGSGTAYEELKAKADNINKQYGREVVTLTGARTDVVDLISAGDIFVGVSRAALEAMSEEKPVVLAGAQGYIGIFDERVCDLAVSTNFCCRGERLPDAELITNDILKLYNMDAPSRARLGEYNRSVILSGYSTSRMTDDYEKVYSMLTAPKYKRGDIIISGYYGFKNMGDDSLLKSMIDGIRALRPDAKITVLSNSPKLTTESCRVRAINRFNLPKIAREMRSAKLLISGGGSLLQDGTSKKSLFYYVTIMRMAKRAGLKLMLYANGLGPLVDSSSRKLAAEIMAKADYISLREDRSRQLARELGIPGSKLRPSADPAFLTKPCESEWTEYIEKRDGIAERCFVVSVKEGDNFGDKKSRGGSDLVGRLAGDIREIAQRYSLMPLFVPMHNGKDMDITEALAKRVGYGKILPHLTASELCAILPRCELVIGTRLHMLIFAAAMGVPMIGVSYDPKIDAFLDYIGQREYCYDIRTIASGELCAAVEKIIANRDKIRAELPKSAERLRVLAKVDCQEAIELVTEN